MTSYRQTAVLVGVLFIIATAFLFIGEALYKPFLDSPDVLSLAHPNRAQVIVGILLEFVIVLAMPLIAVVFYPVLRRFNEALAVGYVVFRSLESIVLIAVAEVGKLSLIGVSQAYLSGEGTATTFQTISSAIQSTIYWGDTSGLLYVILFVVGGFMLYPVLYQSRLIPRWLSSWGLVADVLILAAVVMAQFVPISLALELALVLPIAAQEMVMALWLIVKGFNPSAIDAAAGRPDISKGLRLARA